ncbi:TPA: hypothetical protein QCR24_004291 [Bacillus cereus]|nr:hypothetical protein [Bacillus cereus]
MEVIIHPKIIEIHPSGPAVLASGPGIVKITEATSSHFIEVCIEDAISQMME